MTVKINLRSISPSLGLTSRVSEWDASRKGYATRIRSEYQLVKLRGHAQLVWIVMKAALRRPTGEVDVRCMKHVQEERKGKSFFWGEEWGGGRRRKFIPEDRGGQKAAEEGGEWVSGELGSVLHNWVGKSSQAPNSFFFFAFQR